MVSWVLETARDFNDAVIKLSGMIRVAATIKARIKGALILPGQVSSFIPRAKSLLFEQ